jgi:hypothetical protein
VRGTFQPKSDLPVPGGKPREGSKDAGKADAKGTAPAGTEPPVALKPAGELAPPVAK